MQNLAPVMGVLLAAALTMAATTTLAARQGQFQKRLAWFKQRPALFRTVLATFGSAVLLVLAYFFVFDRTHTRGYGDVAGMLNANQGVLSLLGLIVAGLTVIISVVGRESVVIASRKAQRDSLFKRVGAVIDECIHNLSHFAGAVDNRGRITRGPSADFTHLSSLLQDPRIDLLDRQVINQASTLWRKHEEVEAAAGCMATDEATDLSDEICEDCQQVMKAYALVSLRLLSTVARHHKADVSEYFAGTPLREEMLKALTHLPKAALAFVSSRPTTSLSDLRAAGRPLVVWVDDAAPKGVQVIEMGRIFEDMLRTRVPHAA